jgi:CubicO group peptidase (beta-lactamase class C family)
MCRLLNMKNRRPSYLSLTLLAALFCSCASIPKPPESIGRVSEFQDYVNKLVESGSPPGLSFAVVKGDSVVYSKGFGWADEPRNIRATATTVYHWWSCTKIATAIAVLQLQETGKLSLTDPVIQHLPFFDVEYPSENSKKVTILNLLNHTSGLPDPSALTLMSWIHHHREAALNQTDFVKKVLPDYSKLRFEPGARAEYSNLGYMVLGAIIESAAGTSYEDYIRRHILRPLRMNNTDFVYTLATESEEAAGSHPLWNVLTPLLPFIAASYIREVADGHIWMERVYTDQTPPSGLIGSVTDASRLVAAYLNGGLLDGQRILSEESVAVMTREGQINGRSDDSLNYRRQGIGWQVYGNAGRWVLTHDGGGPGFSTKIQLYPDEHLGFVLFTNDATCEVWKIVRLASFLKW